MARRSSCAALDLLFIQCHPSVNGRKREFLEWRRQYVGTVVFSHGKESGPWGSKITAMAAVVRDLGLGGGVGGLSRHRRSAPRGSQKLIERRRQSRGPLVLVGSSMGGHVVGRGREPAQARAACSCWRRPFTCRASRQYTPQDVACPTAIVHGWHDDIVPVENSIRWAREHQAALHVLDSDHRLEDQIEAICRCCGLLPA